jgi:hypothetical protein
MKDRRSTAAGFAWARYVPPSGFGYPRGGLLPPSPCRSSFIPAALMGFALRSFLLPKGIQHVAALNEPTYRFSRRCSRRRCGGSARRAAVPGLSPFQESLATATGLVWRAPDAPLGFTLLGLAGRGGATGFHPRSSHALLRRSALRPKATGASEYRPASPWPNLRPANRPSDRTTLAGFLHRTKPESSSTHRPGYEFTSRRVVHYCRPPTLLGRQRALPAKVARA